MDNNNQDKVLDVSGISSMSDATFREQPSQLNIGNTNGYLHSTFNYPLHSTVNFMNLSLDLSSSQTMIVDPSESGAENTDTLVNSKDTVGSHNVNVIGGSTVASEARSDQSRDVSANTQSVDATDSMIASLSNNSGQCKQQQKQQQQPQQEHYSREYTLQKPNTNCQLPVGTAGSVVRKHERNDVNPQRHCVNKRQLAADSTVAPSTKPLSKKQEQQPPLTEELLKTFNEKMRQTEKWVTRHDGLNWIGDGESDCDSSCLSFDVDDVSLSLDDTIAEKRNISPRDVAAKPEVSTNNAQAFATIADTISNHLWGHSLRLHDLKHGGHDVMANGSCDVCRLLRLKRQWGCTDLWSDSTDPSNSSKGSLKSHPSNAAQSLSFMDRLREAHEQLHESLPNTLKRPHPVGVSCQPSPKRRYTISGAMTPSRSTSADNNGRSDRSARKHKSTKRSLRRMSQVKTRTNTSYEQPIKMLTHERLAPEGCDDKENSRPSSQSSRSLNPTNTYVKHATKSELIVGTPNKATRKDSDIVLPHRKPSRSSKSATKIRKTMGECFSGNIYNAPLQTPTCARTEFKTEKQTVIMTPKSVKFGKQCVTPTSFRSYSGLPVPESPWTTDKKELKRKMKRMSRSLKHDKENINLQPLGCI